MTDCSELERRDFEEMIKSLEQQVECLQKCLASRDDFLVDHGMFGLYLVHLKQGEAHDTKLAEAYSDKGNT